MILVKWKHPSKNEVRVYFNEYDPPLEILLELNSFAVKGENDSIEYKVYGRKLRPYQYEGIRDDIIDKLTKMNGGRVVESFEWLLRMSDRSIKKKRERFNSSITVINFQPREELLQEAKRERMLKKMGQRI